MADVAGIQNSMPTGSSVAPVQSRRRSPERSRSMLPDDLSRVDAVVFGSDPVRP